MTRTKQASAPLDARVRRAIAEVHGRDGFVSPVNLLIQMGALSRHDYEEWRAGRVPYLEKVVQGSLPRLLRVLGELARIARGMGLKPSPTVYRHRGHPLRFSKTGTRAVEQRYTTHFVGRKLVAAARERKAQKDSRAAAMRAAVDRVLASAQRAEPYVVSELPAGLTPKQLRGTARWLEAELAATPVPLGAAGDSAAGRRRRALERLASAVAAARGKAEARLLALELDWLEGNASALPYLLLLLERGERDRAATLARYALSRPDCGDADRLRELLGEAATEPPSWAAALDAFVADPTEEGWKSLMHFVPEDVLYQRLRRLASGFVERGMPADTAFAFVSRVGMTPDLVGWIETGQVSPEALLARARQAPPSALGMWTGLAAQSAFERGDARSAIRLLKESLRLNCVEFPPLLHVLAIRRRASEEEQAMLDAEGLPRD